MGVACYGRRHALDCIQRVRRRGAGSIEVRADVQERFNDWVQERMADTVW